MRLTQRTEYAVRALLELARRQGDGPTSAREIASAQKIPVRFLEQVLQELKRAGLVDSQRGASGGAWLAREPDKISLSEVVDVVEGALVTRARTDPFDENVRDQAHSAVQELWLNLQITIRERLSQVTLADLVRRQDELDRTSYLVFQI